MPSTRPDSGRRRWSTVLALAALSACSTSPTSATDDASAADVAPALAACGEHFIAAQTDFPDAGRITLCQPLTSDGLAIDVHSCIPTYTSGAGEAGFSLLTAGDGTAFSTLGPTMLGVGLIGRGPPCTADGGFCSYRTGLTPCRAVVTRAGRAGDTVEAEIREPCRLVNDDGVAALIVDRLRVRGVLRLRFELNVRSHSDAGVQRALECGVR